MWGTNWNLPPQRLHLSLPLLISEADGAPVMSWSVTGNGSSACPLGWAAVLFDPCFWFSLHNTPDTLGAPEETLWLMKISHVKRRANRSFLWIVRSREMVTVGPLRCWGCGGSSGQLSKGCGETSDSFLTFILKTIPNTNIYLLTFIYRRCSPQPCLQQGKTRSNPKSIIKEITAYTYMDIE